MKEFEYTFQEGLRKGLRTHHQNPRNEEALVECHNWAPTEKGLEPHEAMVSLNASSITWGGLGKWTEAGATRNITIHVSDYISLDDLSNVSVYIDDALQGTTDASGEIDIDSVAVGGHSLKLTKAGYLDSDTDDLLNDYIVVA